MKWYKTTNYIKRSHVKYVLKYMLYMKVRNDLGTKWPNFFYETIKLQNDLCYALNDKSRYEITWVQTDV